MPILRNKFAKLMHDGKQYDRVYKKGVKIVDNYESLEYTLIENTSTAAISTYLPTFTAVNSNVINYQEFVFTLKGGSTTKDRNTPIKDVVKVTGYYNREHYNRISFKNLSNIGTITKLGISDNITSMHSMFYGCSNLTSINMSGWDTSNVTTMYSVFRECSKLTSLNLSGWNTSNVTNLESAFYNCTGLTSLNLSGWNTSNVTNMNSTFRSCSALTSLNLSNFNTSKVVTMQTMFADSSKLTSLDLSNFNTRNLGSTNYMFSGCTGLTSLNLSGWSNTKVANMAYMFNNCKNLSSLNITNWGTSAVTTMDKMFNGCSKLTSLNVSTWNTSNVTNMSSMFNSCSALTSLNLSNFDTSNVTSMSHMFFRCSSLTSLDVSNFDTSNVTNMTYMFNNCSKLTSLDLSRWNTSKVTSSSYSEMFGSCKQSCIGYYCPGLWTLPTSGRGFDITWVAPFNIYEIDLSLLSSSRTVTLYENIDVEPFTYWGDGTYNGELTHSYSETSGIVTVYTNLFHTRKAANIEYSFIDNNSTTFVSRYMPTITGASNLDYIFILKDGTESTNTGTEVRDIERVEVRFDDNFVTKISFKDLKLIKEINRFKLPSRITDMSSMFQNCSDLVSVNTLTWDMTNVTNVSNMFSGCTSLQSLEFSDWDTSNVVNCENMFLNVPIIEDWNYTGDNYKGFKLTEEQTSYCDFYPWSIFTVEYNITIDENEFHSISWKDEMDLSVPFKNRVLPLLYENDNSYYPSEKMVKIYLKDGTVTNDLNILESLNTIMYEIEKIKVNYIPSVTQIKFIGYDPGYEQSKIKHLVNEIFHIDSENLTSMEEMFYASCIKSSKALEELNTSKVSNMSKMFYSSHITDLNLSNWDTSNVTNISYMFCDCPVINLNLSNWNVENVIDARNFLCDTYNLINLNLSNWDTRNWIPYLNTEYMLCIVNTHLLDWNYDGDNYSNFTLMEEETNYDNTFPWNLREVKYRIASNNENAIISSLNYKAGSMSSLSEYKFVLKNGEIKTNPNNIEYKDLDYIVKKYDFNNIGFSGSDVSEIIEFDTSKIKIFGYMFENCQKLVSIDMTSWDMSNAVSLEGMFKGCTKLSSVNASNWNMPNLERTNEMFYNCESLTNLNLSGWNITKSQVSNSSYMFTGVPELTANQWGYNGSNYTGFNLSEIDTDYSGIFPWTETTYAIYEINNKLFPNDTFNMLIENEGGNSYHRYMPVSGSRLNYEIELNNGNIVTDFSNFYVKDVKKVKVYYNKYHNLSFAKCPSVEDGENYISKLIYCDTSNMTKTSLMFYGCKHLTSIEAKNWDLRNVYNSYGMFWDCSSLTSLDLSGWKLRDMYNMSSMFDSCTSLTSLNLSGWDTSNVVVMCNMFEECYELESLDISHFSVKNVVDMIKMFWKCRSLKDLKLFKWDSEVRSEVYVCNMFEECQSLESVDLSDWDLRYTTDFYNMFTGCTSLKSVGNLSNWCTDSLEDASEMFKNCSSLISLNLSNWNIDKLRDADSMFENCSSLTSLNLSNWNTKNIKYVDKFLSGIPTIADENWGYDGENYSKFNLVEEQVSYNGEFPWSEFAYLEYTVYPANENDTLLKTGSNNIYSYIPTYAMNYSENEYLKDDIQFFQTSSPNYFTITLLDGNTTNDLSTNVNNIEKIKIKFNKRIENIQFGSYEAEGESNISSVLSFDCGHLANLSYVLAGCQYITDLDLSNWDTGNITNMNSAFLNCQNLVSINLDGLSIEKLTSVRSMFENCSSLTSLDLSGWESNIISNIQYLFYGCSMLEQLSLPSFMYIANGVEGVFRNCQSLKSLDLTNWNSANIISAKNLFRGCTSLEYLNLSNWNTLFMLVYDDMFTDVPALETDEAWAYDGNNYTYFNICEVLSGYCDLFPWSEVGIMEYSISPRNDTDTVGTVASSDCSLYLPLLTYNEKQITSNRFIELQLKGGRTTNDFNTLATDIERIKVKFNKNRLNTFKFCGDYNNSSRITQLHYIDFTRAISSAMQMFQYSLLESIDMSNWDVSNVLSTRMMFSNCPIQNIDFSNLNFANLSDMHSMFISCKNLTSIQGLDKLDISKVGDISFSFNGCNALDMDSILDQLSGWDVSNVYDMDYLFASTNIENVNKLSNWNTPSLKYMSGMFSGCTSLVTINAVENWNTENLIDISSIFSGCTELVSVDLSNWNKNKLENLNYAFKGCSALLEIKGISDLNIQEINEFNYMFQECSSLQSLDLSGWNTIDIEGKLRNIFTGIPTITAEGWGYTGDNYEQFTITEYLSDYCDLFPWSEIGYIEYTISHYNTKHTLKSVRKSGYVTYLPYFFDINGNKYINNQPNFYEISLLDKSITNDLNTPAYDVSKIKIKFNKKLIKRISFAGYFSASSSGSIVNSQITSLLRFDCDRITSFENLFTASIVNYIDCSDWNTSSVTSFYQSFTGCDQLQTLDVSKWDVSNATTMYQMFYSCDNLTTLDVTNWDVSSVTNLANTFGSCESLTQLGDLSNWDVSNVTNFSSTFSETQVTTLGDLSNWNTSKATTMSGMFYECGKLISVDMSKWDVSNVTSFRWTFYYCYKLETIGDVSNWNTSKVTEIENMFARCSSLTGVNVSNWDTSNVRSMYGLFDGCISITSLDAHNWDVSNVTTMENAFSGIGLTTVDFNNWNTSNVTNMDSIFKGCKQLRYLLLPDWNVEKVTTLEAFISGCNALEVLNLSGWKTKKLKTVSFMMRDCSSLVDVDMSNFDLRQVSNDVSYINHAMDGTADVLEWHYDGTNYTNWIHSPGKLYYDYDFPWAYTTSCELEYTISPLNNTDYLDAKYDDEYIYLPNYSSSHSISFTSVLITKKNGTTATSFSSVLAKDVEKINIKYSKDASIRIGNNSSSNVSSRITTITKLPTTRQTSLENMFYMCSLLTSLPDKLVIHDFVTNTRNMFAGCSQLQNLNTSYWELDTVTSIDGMFADCSSLTSLDVSNINTYNVLNMERIFYNCSNLQQLNVTDWDVINVTNLNYTFSGCNNLISLDLSKWDAQNLESMNSTFKNCSSLTSLDLSSLNTSDVTDIGGLFEGLIVQSLDLSNWDVSNVTNMSNTFANCSSLVDLDLSTWNTANVSSSENMFAAVPQLTSDQWNYDGNNYINWSLVETSTGYSYKFPWNETYIEYTVDNSSSLSLNHTDNLDGETIYPSLPRLYKYDGSGFIQSYNNIIITKLDGSTTNDLNTPMNNIKNIKVYYDSLGCNAVKFGGVNITGNSYIKELIYLKDNLITDISAMFANCTKLQSLDLSNFNTRKITDISHIFYNCESLTNLNLSNWNIPKNIIVDNSFTNVTIDNSNWIYNKIMFVPTGPECGYATDFPWPSILDVTIDYTLSSSSVPAYPSWYSLHKNDSNYYFVPGTATITGLVPNNKGIGNTNAWTCFKIVSPSKGQLQIKFVNNGESGCDFGIIHLTTTDVMPTNYDDLIFIGDSYENQTSRTVTANLTEGATYYLHFQYVKDGSVDSGYDALIIQQVRFTNDEDAMI